MEAHCIELGDYLTGSVALSQALFNAGSRLIRVYGSKYKQIEISSN